MPRRGPSSPDRRRTAHPRADGLRPLLARLAASYDRRLSRPRGTASRVARLCAAEVRDAVLAPVLGIAVNNRDVADSRLAHMIRVTLGLRRTAPPPLPPDAHPDDAARLHAAWTRELARLRRCLDEAGV